MTVRILCALGIGALLAVFGAGDAAAWTTYRSGDGSYTIELPGQPEVFSVQGRGPGDPPVLYQVRHVTPGRLILMLIHADYPSMPNPQQFMEADRDSFVSGMKGTLVASRNTRYQRGPGDELAAVEFALVAENMTCKSLVVVEPPRTWMMGACGFKGQDVTADVERVIGSFRIARRR